MNISEAAQDLIERIDTKSRFFIFYEPSYYELIEALENPLLPPTFLGRPVEGAEDEDAVCFYARALVFEISELANDPHYDLPECKALIALLEAEGIPHCDARKMTAEEHFRLLSESCSVIECPPELNEKILALLMHKARPN